VLSGVLSFSICGLSVWMWIATLPCQISCVSWLLWVKPHFSYSQTQNYSVVFVFCVYLSPHSTDIINVLLTQLSHSRSLSVSLPFP
jgi:hypothetical protein